MTEIFFNNNLLLEEGEGGGYSTTDDSFSSKSLFYKNDHFNQGNESVANVDKYGHSYSLNDNNHNNHILSDSSISEGLSSIDDDIGSSIKKLKKKKTKPFSNDIKAKDISSLIGDSDSESYSSPDLESNQKGKQESTSYRPFRFNTNRVKSPISKSPSVWNKTGQQNPHSPQLKLTRVKNIDSFSNGSSSNKYGNEKNFYKPKKREIDLKTIKGRPPPSRSPSNNKKSYESEPFPRKNPMPKPMPVLKPQSSEGLIPYSKSNAGYIRNETGSFFDGPLAKKSFMKSILSCFSAYDIDACNGQLKKCISDQLLDLGEKLETKENPDHLQFYFLKKSSIPTYEPSEKKYQSALNSLRFYKKLAGEIDVNDL